MAYREQLIIIKYKGVRAWNKWRERNKDVKIDLSKADLNKVNLNKANLNKANLRRADLRGLGLRGADLRGADLRGADLRGASVSRSDLSKADLREVNFFTTRALETNFKGATLTGACIQDWNINNQTKFNDVICDYIYLKEGNQERIPHDLDRIFKSGEFTKYIEKVLNTVDLIFTDGIDWKAFFASFQTLQDKYGAENLGVQAIERKSGDTFIVRIEVPPDANKAEIENYAKQSYDTKLQVLEAQYRTKLDAKNAEIAIYRQHNTDLLDIIKLKAAQPITENNFHAPVGSVDNKGTQNNISGEVNGNQSK